MPTTPIKSFGPVSSLTDSTEIGVNLTTAMNLLLRPNKGFRGIPVYYRLFGTGNTVSMQDTIRALTFGTPTPVAIGDTPERRTANKTVAIQVACQAKNFLLLYDLTATTKPCRGWFYLGEKGTVPSTLDLDDGVGLTYTVLAVGLNAGARWYGTRTYSQWLLGNGVDENVCVQINRTAYPGVWRKAASNAKPSAPVISTVVPSSSALVQSSWTVDNRLKLTADADNYPGASGNDRIRVTITPTVAALTSVLTGSGTPTTDPFNYSITGGMSGTATYPQADVIKSFINLDTKILSILQASLVSSDAPITSQQGPTLLSGGTGTGTSSGFSDRTATVIARYWDPGTEGLGYEGISSDDSNTLIISAAQNFDIRVRITPDPNAEGGRFPFIRLYLNFTDSSGTEIFSLMNPNDPIPNTTPTGKTFSVNVSTDTLTTTTAHGLAVGDIVRVSTSATLPAPLLASTDYVVQAVPSTTTLKLTAVAGGAAINLTTTGTGVQTLTPQRTVTLGTESVIGRAMSEDQNRPLPHQHHCLANSQVWRAGVTGYQERLYASKPAEVDELVPEGCYTDDFTNVQSTTSAAGSSEITALYTDGSRLHLHTLAGILLKDPTAPLEPSREPQVATGAINGTCMVAMPDRRIFYVGSDLSLVAFDASVQLQEIVGTASVVSAQATAYIRARVDTNAIAANNDRAHAFIDAVGQLLWFYLPGTSGTLIGFAYDLMTNGIVGEFTYPKVYASTMLEKTRPEIIFADEDANLFWTDPTTQPDHQDNYGSQGAFAPQAIGAAIPVADNGYGNVIYDAGAGSKRYLRAYQSILETGYWDMGDPSKKRAFLGFLWRTINNSRCIVTITLKTLDNQTQSFTFGDVGDYAAAARAPLMLSDSAIKVRMTILSAEQKSWAFRDVAIDWAAQNFASL